MSAVVALAPQAAPAAAAPGPGLPSGEVVCFMVYKNGIPIGIRCIAFRPIVPDCIKCDALVLDYGTDIFVHDSLVDGFVLLDKAEHAIDPADRAAFHQAALDRFMTVAMAVPDGVTADTGFVDRKTGRFAAEPRPWLMEAGTEIDAGLRLLQVAGIDPDGDPAHALKQGMHHLGNAYDHLAQGR